MPDQQDSGVGSPVCPQCHDGHGCAISVSVTSNDRTVTYTCSDCGWTWSATDRDAPSATPFIERRKTPR